MNTMNMMKPLPAKTCASVSYAWRQQRQSLPTLKKKGRNNTIKGGPRIELRTRLTDTLGVALEARREIVGQQTGTLPSLSLLVETLLRQQLGLPVPEVEPARPIKGSRGRARKTPAAQGDSLRSGH